MVKQSIEKENFYLELIRMMELAQKSIKFYSVSCCFGFYSRGLANFQDVLRSIKNALSRQGARYLEVKILVKIDRDNPMDMYAAERWPAPVFEDTKFGVTMGPEVGHGETEVYAGVQA
jgi:hypothetical protein